MGFFHVRFRFFPCPDAVDKVLEVEVDNAAEFVDSRLRDDRLTLTYARVSLKDLPSAAVPAEAHKAFASADFDLRRRKWPIGKFGLVL